MLLLGSRRAAEQVHGARLHDQGSALPVAGAFAPQAKPTGRAEGYADNVAICRAVPVPANRSPRSVFADERLLKFAGSEAREIGGPLPQRQQELGNAGAADRCVYIGVVMQTIRDDAPSAGISMKLVFPEIQLAKMREELGLLVGGHKRRSVGEPFRKRREGLEKTELTTTHRSPDDMGCARLCEKMSEISPEELAGAIVRDAAHRYIEDRRTRIDAFVDRHFTFAGSLALHRCALGWDLVRAPANLFLAGPALALKLTAWAAQRAGPPRVAAWLAEHRLLLKTEVARQIEWLVAAELLEIPCRYRDRVSHRDAIAETILADERAVRVIAPLLAGGAIDSDFRPRIVAAIEAYLGSRTAAAEIATGFAAAGLGALLVKQATPGLITLSSAVAATIAQQMAIAAFPLGAGLGGLWYSLFPPAAGPELLAATTAGVFLGGAMLAAFCGVITDPLQRRLGLHRRRLERFLQMVEIDLSGEPGRTRIMRDHYVARLVDLFDLIALAMRVSHA